MKIKTAVALSVLLIAVVYFASGRRDPISRPADFRDTPKDDSPINQLTEHEAVNSVPETVHITAASAPENFRVGQKVILNPRTWKNALLDEDKKFPLNGVYIVFEIGLPIVGIRNSDGGEKLLHYGFLLPLPEAETDTDKISESPSPGHVLRVGPEAEEKCPKSAEDAPAIWKCALKIQVQYKERVIYAKGPTKCEAAEKTYYECLKVYPAYSETWESKKLVRKDFIVERWVEETKVNSSMEYPCGYGWLKRERTDSRQLGESPYIDCRRDSSTQE